VNAALDGAQWPDAAPWWSLGLLAIGVFIGWNAGGALEIDRAQRRADLADLDREVAAFLAAPAAPPDDPGTEGGTDAVG
jgi:hypothetical protein